MVRIDAARMSLLGALGESTYLPYWTDRVVRTGLLQIADASPSYLDRSVGEGWLAIGDAAASFDPIASQGLANAFASALAGAEAVNRHLNGDHFALKEFARSIAVTWRRSVLQLPAIYDAAACRWATPFWRSKAAAMLDKACPW
jgi:hypothetical protein